MEEIIGTTAAVIAIIGGLYQGFTWLSTKQRDKAESKPTDRLDSLASRFVHLFEAHGVHRNQIPEFFGHQLSLADVQTDKSLLPKLSPNLLRDAAEVFQINSEWLDHGQGEIFPLHHFYKQPKQFGDFIDDLLSDSKDKKLEGYVLTIKPPFDLEEDTLILLQESIGEIGKRTIYRYHLCPGWRLNYWKCCADIACCISQAQKRDIYLKGLYLEKKWLESFAEGGLLPDYEFDFSDIALPRVGGWQPDEFADTPDKFISPLSTTDGYSIPSAIDRWLDYFNKGEIFICSEPVNKEVGKTFSATAKHYEAN